MRQLLIGTSVLTLLFVPGAFGQTTSPPTKTKKLKKAGFDLKKFEASRMMSKGQMRQMEQISKTRQQLITRSEKLLRDRPLYPHKAQMLFRLGEWNWQEAKYQYLKARAVYNTRLDAYEGKRLAVKPVEPKEDYAKALSYYRQVIQQYPDYRRIDEVMYYLGRGALQQGKETKDRNLVRQGVDSYHKLVEKYPKSRFMAQTYLALGEHFFETDSLYRAKMNYEHIINKFPRAGMFNYALYKLGWVYYNLREFRKTVTTFQKVVTRVSSAKGYISFRDQALNDLVKTYAEMDDSWREALDYFKGVIKSEKTVYRKMEALGQLYVGLDKDKEAIELYNHFIGRTPNSNRIPDFLDQVLAVRKKINDFSKTEKEIRRILAYFKPKGRWVTANKGNSQVLKQAWTLAHNNLFELANHWHRAADKADKYKKRKIANEMYRRAAADYDFFLRRFPDSKHRYMVSFYFAEILYAKSHNYERALVEYQKVIELDKKGKFVEDAALGVIYSSYELMVKAGIRKRHAKGGRVKVVRVSETEMKKRRETKIAKTKLHKLETAYVDAADQYVDLLLTLRKDPVFRKKYPKRGALIPEIMYEAAETFFRHGQFANSVSRLRKIFDYDPGHKYAAIAVVTMIKAYARLRHWNRVEELSRRLIKQRNYKYKTKVELRRYIAIAMQENADDLSKAQKHDEAIAESMRLYNEFRKDKKLASKALQAVATLYYRAKRIKKAVQIYEKIVKLYKKQNEAPLALFKIGQIYENQTRYKDAASAFMKLAKFKTKSFAPNAVFSSARLHEALQDYPEAIKGFRKWLKLFGKKKDAADNAVFVDFKIGLIYEEMGDLKNLQAAVKHFTKFAKNKRYKARKSFRIQALARAGDLLRRIDDIRSAMPSKKKKKKKTKRTRKNRKLAMKLYTAAINLFRTMVTADDGSGAVDPKKVKGVEVHTKAAAAKSAFWLANYVYEDFVAYKVPGTKKVKALLKALKHKAELFQKAEVAMDAVYIYKNAGQSACAAFRNGLLYYNFAKEILDIPIAEGLSLEEEDRQRLVLEGWAKPPEEKAVILLGAAMKLAHQTGVYNKCSKQAGVYASKVNPDGFPIHGEEMVKPNRTRDTLLSANFIRTLRRGNVAVDMLENKKKGTEKKKKTDDKKKTKPTKAAKKTTMVSPKVPKKRAVSGGRVL